MEFGQAGSSMQGERGSGWMPGLQENTTGGTQFPGPPPAFAPPGQMGPGNQAPHPPPVIIHLLLISSYILNASCFLYFLTTKISLLNLWKKYAVNSGYGTGTTSAGDEPHTRTD